MKVLIGIPTTRSHSYIFASLERIIKEIRLCSKKWNMVVALCLNGEDCEGKTEKEIRRFFEIHNDIECYVLIEKQQGKNNSINKIVSFARSLMHVDIIHFFDDDVYLQKGSLLANVESLIANERKNNKPTLVGSAFIGISHSFGFFLGRYPLSKAIKKWVCHILFIQPYLLNSERPQFCEGPSFGTYLKYMPKLPGDSMGITDDSYLSNFFAIRGKEEYEKNNVPFIIKPHNSISYVEISSNFKEWRNQQIRIHAGIERSFAYFNENRNFLEKYFSWSYAFNRESRISPKSMSLKRKILYYIYMYLHEKNRKYAQCLVEKNKVPNWAIANGTKNLFLKDKKYDSKHISFHFRT